MQKLKSVILVALLVLLPLAQAVHAQSGALDQTARVKAEVAKRVDNKKTRVKVKLLSGEEVKGRIDQATDDTFTVIEDKTGRKVDLKYSDVASVKGRGMSTLTKVGIVTGVAIVVVAVAVVVAVRNFDPFSGGIRIP